MAVYVISCLNMALEGVMAHPLVALGGAISSYILLSYWRRPKNLPPGPMNFPIVGAISCFGGNLEAKLMKLKKRYGDVISFYRYDSVVIILNSGDMIHEALLKSPEEFAPRVKEGNMSDGLCLKDDIFAGVYNEGWKKNKKFILSTLKTCGFGTAKSECKLHAHIELLEKFLLDSNEAAIDISSELKILNSGIISTVLMGDAICWNSDRSAELFRHMEKWFQVMFSYLEVVHPFGEACFPLLAKVLSKSKHDKLVEVTERINDYLKTRVLEHVEGIAEREPENVIDMLLKERGTDPEAIEHISRNLVLYLLDSIDTAGIVDHWSIFFLSLYQEVQTKLQNEVEEIVGNSRYPTLADRNNMPYAQAIVHETLRHMLLANISLARRVKNGTTLGAYNIPKNAVVCFNWEAANYDPQVFPEPNSFNPSRFIDSKGKFNVTLAGKMVTFGAGTRTCIGSTYFKNHLFLLLTHLGQKFEITFDPSSPSPKREDIKFSMHTPIVQYKCCYKQR